MSDDTFPRKFAFGAMPPAHAAWQIGKTAASITFVKDAMAIQDGLDRVKVALHQLIELVQDGKTVIDKFTTQDEIWAMAQRRAHENQTRESK